MAAANIESVSGPRTEALRPLAVNSLVRHARMRGYYVVSKISEDGVLIQDCLSSAVYRSEVSDLSEASRSSDVFTFKALLREYQHRTVNYILSEQRTISILSMGAGKTLVGFSTYLRLCYDAASRVRLRQGDIFLVLTEANLVHEVWAKEASKFGLSRQIHLKLTGELPDEKQLVVDSYQNFWMHASGDPGNAKAVKIYDPQLGTLWNRPVVALFLDEVHRLSGFDTWNKAVSEMSRRAVLVAGVTGTFFANEPDRAANMCRAVGLAAPLQQRDYWRAADALVQAKEVVGGICEVREDEITAEAPRRARVPLCKKVFYEGQSGRRQCEDGLSEILGVPLSEAASFHRLPSREDKVKCLVEQYKPWARPSSKLQAFINVISDLLEGRGFERRHHKIQVTVMYNDSVVILVTT